MPGVPRSGNASALPPTASAATPRDGSCWPGPPRPHPAGALVPAGGGVHHGESPTGLAPTGDGGGIGPDRHRRSPARRPLGRAHHRPTAPACTRCASSTGSHPGRGRCGPRSTAPPTPSDWFTPEELRDMPLAHYVTDRRGPACRERDGRDDRRPAAPCRHHRVAASAASSPPSALKRATVRVTLIDRTNHHLFQPLLYQVATGILSEGQIAPADPRRAAQLSGPAHHPRRGGAHRRRGPRGPRSTSSANRSPSATTASSSPAAPRAPTSVTTSSAAVSCGMKSLDDALALRGNIFGSFELAEAETDPEKRRRLMTFVVVGGGPTGVEMPGQLRELSRRALRHNYRMIDPRRHPRRAGGGPGPARRLHGDLPVAHDRARPRPAWASRSTSAPW